VNEKQKKRQIRALKGPIKWQMPDGTIVEDTVKDFMARGIYTPYIPLFTTSVDILNFPPK